MKSYIDSNNSSTAENKPVDVGLSTTNMLAVLVFQSLLQKQSENIETNVETIMEPTLLYRILQKTSNADLMYMVRSREILGSSENWLNLCVPYHTA